MQWWNFQDTTFLIFFIVIVSSFAFLLFYVVTFILSYRFKLKRQLEIGGETSTVRIYNIDFKNNSVVFFDRRSLNQKKKITLAQFYHRFSDEDADKVRNWLYAICVENRTVNDFIEVDMVSSRGRSIYFSVLKKIKFDPKVGLLHLESHLMKYIVPHVNSATHNKQKHTKGLLTNGEMRTLVLKQKSASGYTFCIRFFYIGSKDNGYDRIGKVTISNLKNVVYEFMYSRRPRQIIDESPNELFLFDLTINDKDKAIKLVASIVHELKKTIGIMGYEEDISFAIGAVENVQYYQDFDAIIKTSQLACIYSQQHNLTSYFYTRSSKLILSETGKYSQEISRLLKPNNLKLTFRAIVDANKGKIIGYFNDVIAPESPFTNYMEMSKYSAKVHRNKEFYAFVSKKIISKFTNENNNGTKLFMQTSLTDISFINEVFGQIPNINNSHVVLVFYERDFDEEDNDYNSIYQMFETIKKYNVEVALLLHDQNLLLEPEIYSNFDYFVIGSSMVKEIKKSNSKRLSIHTLVEQLLKYKKPIIATDIEGWQAIELIVNSGIAYLSSEVISPSSSMLLSLDKKKIDKLVTMSNNYL